MGRRTLKTDYKYLQRYTDNRGKPRCNYRRKGFLRPLRNVIGSDAFEVEYAQAQLDYQNGKTQALKMGKRGTVDGAIISYYQSMEYVDLADNTKKTYRNNLEFIREKWGDKPVAGLQVRHLKAIMRDATTPAAGNRLLRFFRMILSHCVELEWITHNIAREIRNRKVESEGHLDWPEELIEKYESYWPIGTRARLIFALALYTGQRRSDLVNMTRAHFKNGYFYVVQEKTKEKLLIPIHPKLQEVIEGSDLKGFTILETQHGKPMSPNSVTTRMREHRNEAGIPEGYSIHGLRKSAARRLAEAGATDLQVGAVTGHKTLSEVQRYTAGARQKDMAERALELLIENENSTKSV